MLRERSYSVLEMSSDASQPAARPSTDILVTCCPPGERSPWGGESADTAASTWQVQVFTVLHASFVTMAISPKNCFSLLFLHLPTAQGHAFVMSLSCREMTRQSTRKVESMTSAKVNRHQNQRKFPGRLSFQSHT